MSGPKLTDEDREVLERMLANREKARARYAEQGPPTPLPDDSPIQKKWRDDPFLASSLSATTEVEPNDVAWQLAELQSVDPESRTYILRAIAANPLADEQILAACERLLDDRTIALLSIPYSFGEIRWLAAIAVATLRGVLGRTENVVIDDAFEPVTSAEALAKDAGITPSAVGGPKGTIETLERLAAVNRLPRRRIVREPIIPEP